jgi:hypothetical protein
MIRSTFRNLMLGLLSICLGLSYYLFTLTQGWQMKIVETESDIVRLNQELENARNLNVALTELDNLTITEQTATQLDILRHLGLEQSDLDFTLESRDTENVGGTSLFAHTVKIGGKMNYESALALVDRLQNTKKIVIGKIEIQGPTTADPNITLDVTGRIYGLEKTTPPPGSETPASPPEVK